MAGRWQGEGTSHAADSKELSREAGFPMWVQKIANDEKTGLITDFEGRGVPTILVGYKDKVAYGARYLNKIDNSFYYAIYQGNDVIFSPFTPPLPPFPPTDVVLVTTQTINHNLGTKPLVQTIDSNGIQNEGQVTHIDDNSLTVDFNTPFTGCIILAYT